MAKFMGKIFPGTVELRFANTITWTKCCIRIDHDDRVLNFTGNKTHDGWTNHILGCGPWILKKNHVDGKWLRSAPNSLVIKKCFTCFLLPKRHRVLQILLGLWST